ncbi:MAG: hypothetical protein QXF45_02055 [Candidatus Caldarchaeum sp.]
MSRTFWTLFFAGLALMPVGVSGLNDYWLIGFGGNVFLPFLDGGVLEYDVGESLAVKIVGRDGFVWVVSPAGVVEEVSVADGEGKVLKEFGFGDIGEWIVITDRNETMKVVVRPPVTRPSVQLSFSLEGNEVKATALTSRQSFALFAEGKSDTVKAAGSVVELKLPGINETRVKAEIYRVDQPIRYKGALSGIQYNVEVEQLVSSTILTGQRINGTTTFTVKIPDEEETTSGIKPVGIGLHRLRLVSASDRRLLYETELIVVPSSKKNLEGLSRTLSVDFWEAFRRNYTLIVGDGVGTIWRITIRLPLVVFRIFDDEHRRYHVGAMIQIPDAYTRTIGSEIIAVFTTTLEITDYTNMSDFIPTRETAASISFDASSIETSSLTITAGDVIELGVSLYETTVELVFPNGTKYEGPQIIEINGITYSNTRARYLPRGTYTVRALSPESFTYETFYLARDTTWTIIVVDNLAGLAGLRASAVLLGFLLIYIAYKTLKLRNTFYRPSRK